MVPRIDVVFRGCQIGNSLQVFAVPYVPIGCQNILFSINHGRHGSSRGFRQTSDQFLFTAGGLPWPGAIPRPFGIRGALRKASSRNKASSAPGIRSEPMGTRPKVCEPGQVSLHVLHADSHWQIQRVTSAISYTPPHFAHQ